MCKCGGEIFQSVCFSCKRMVDTQAETLIMCTEEMLIIPYTLILNSEKQFVGQKFKKLIGRMDMFIKENTVNPQKLNPFEE